VIDLGQTTIFVGERWQARSHSAGVILLERD
jgi:hypothetical protein